MLRVVRVVRPAPPVTSLRIVAGRAVVRAVRFASVVPVVRVLPVVADLNEESGCFGFASDPLCDGCAVYAARSEVAGGIGQAGDEG